MCLQWGTLFFPSLKVIILRQFTSSRRYHTDSHYIQFLLLRHPDSKSGKNKLYINFFYFLNTQYSYFRFINHTT